MQVSICPILGTYIQAVLLSDRGPEHLVRDLYAELMELGDRCQQERLSREIVVRRAFRAFELSFLAVFSEHTKGLLAATSPRADLSTMEGFLEKLRMLYEDATVFDVESKLAKLTFRGREQLTQVRMDRVRLGAEFAIKGGEWLQAVTESTEESEFSCIGSMLSSVSQFMMVGLTNQVGYAEELMKHG